MNWTQEAMNYAPVVAVIMGIGVIFWFVGLVLFFLSKFLFKRSLPAWKYCCDMPHKLRIWGRTRRMRKEREKEILTIVSEPLREMYTDLVYTNQISRAEADEMLRRHQRNECIPELLPAIDAHVVKEKIKRRLNEAPHKPVSLPDMVDHTLKGGRRKKQLIVV